MHYYTDYPNFNDHDALNYCDRNFYSFSWWTFYYRILSSIIRIILTSGIIAVVNLIKICLFLLPVVQLFRNYVYFKPALNHEPNVTIERNVIIERI